MHVFLSHSGTRSKAVAELLHTWLPCVIQALKPWVSTQDLERGCLWNPELNNQLADTTVGIVCLTLENKTAPWILFESGALAKGLSKARVCTLLIDLRPEDVSGPLAQFNHTRSNQDDMWKLMQTLNSQLADARLSERTLELVFNRFWPQFETDFKSALDQHPQDPAARPRDPSEMLAEVLNNTRELLQRVSERTSGERKAIAKFYSQHSLSPVEYAKHNLLMGCDEEFVVSQLVSNFDLERDLAREFIELAMHELRTRKRGGYSPTTSPTPTTSPSPS